MRQRDVKLGGRYVAKVSGRLTVVRITGKPPVGKGWVGVNETTGNPVRIRSGAKLRHPA